MKRRTKAVLLIGSLVVATGFATVVMLSAALARRLDFDHGCETGFSALVSCTYHRTSTSFSRDVPIFTTPSSATSTTPSSLAQPFKPYVDATSWAVADCPQNHLAKRLLCAANPGAAQAAIDDSVTGLPVPKPWVLRTAKKSPFIDALHVETLLDLTAALRFYRVELSKRGWTENGGTLVGPDGAVIAFMTADGPALLRLTRQHDRTIADLSRKPAAADGSIRADASILPKPGQVRLMLGNDTDEAAVITINEQTIELAARAGSDLAYRPESLRKSAGGPEINLPPGKYKGTFKLASGAAQNREFEVAADETWALLVGAAGVPLPVQLY
jgi:hypothetical protein